MALVPTVLVIGYLISPPSSATVALSVVIPEGASVRAIATAFAEHGIVRSATLFRAYLIVSERDRSIVPGLYLFEEPVSLFAVADRIAGGDHGVATVKITFPEGMTNREFAQIAASELPLVRADDFLRHSGAEGGLFPDTYFFYETATSGEVASALRDTFAVKTATLRMEAEMNGLDWDNVIILASIVEEEAATPEDRRIIAGILLERLRIGMALGIDATFAYTQGKGTMQITQSDLENKDDPYNTYRHKGLPPTAIANPGRDALEAILDPIKTDYLFYLSDNEGRMHYARTFEEHKKNKARYLR